MCSNSEYLVCLMIICDTVVGMDELDHMIQYVVDSIL